MAPLNHCWSHFGRCRSLQAKTDVVNSLSPSLQSEAAAAAAAAAASVFAAAESRMAVELQAVLFVTLAVQATGASQSRRAIGSNERI